MTAPATPAEDAPTPLPVRRVVRFELAPRTIAVVVGIVAGVWLTTQLVPVLLVLIAALMLVGALNPLVRWLTRHRVRRSVAIAMVLGGAVAVTGVTIFFTVPPLIDEVQALVENEPKIRASIVERLNQSPLTQTLGEQIRNLDYSALLKNSRAKLLSASFHALVFAAYAIAVIFLALYIMVDHDRLRAALFSVVPRKHHVRFSRVLVNLETIVGGYIRGQVITCVLIAIFIFVLLTICRVPNALALAAFGALMDVLPYVGPLLTVIPAVAAAYAVGPAVALTVLVLLIGYEEFEGRVLIPLVYGRALRLPSSVVFFSLLVGAGLGGVIGALLSLPIAAAALMMIDELRVDLPGQNDLPETQAAKRRDKREEREYVQRTDEAPLEQASAVAVELARERKEQETEDEATGKR